MNGGWSAIEDAGGEPWVLSCPMSGRAMSGFGVVAIPEGSFTVACAALCVCLPQG
jgi:hypothetical protein